MRPGDSPYSKIVPKLAPATLAECLIRTDGNTYCCEFKTTGGTKRILRGQSTTLANVGGNGDWQRSDWIFRMVGDDNWFSPNGEVED